MQIFSAYLKRNKFWFNAQSCKPFIETRILGWNIFSNTTLAVD